MQAGELVLYQREDIFVVHRLCVVVQFTVEDVVGESATGLLYRCMVQVLHGAVTVLCAIAAVETHVERSVARVLDGHGVEVADGYRCRVGQSYGQFAVLEIEEFAIAVSRTRQEVVE